MQPLSLDFVVRGGPQGVKGLRQNLRKNIFITEKIKFRV